MEYYVIYDKNDNLVAYCENLDELSKFVNRRKKELKYRFKNRNLFNIEVPNLLRIYKFNWGEKDEKTRIQKIYYLCYSFNFVKISKFWKYGNMLFSFNNNFTYYHCK